MKSTLLCPAGNPKAFYAAISGGADAIYLGVDVFNARRNADNFTLENIGEYIRYAHLFGVKIYVTLNILIKNTELESFFETARKLYFLGADAFILQDVSFGKIFCKYLPDIELHLSTQAGVNNIYGAKEAKENGFCQVVLARETPLSEIEQISKIIKTEVFVQGALCSSFSGQCLMSSFIGGDSGNRGLCRQPCRQKYSLNGGKMCYAISPSDLCVGENIEKFINLGVSAFKIEGRMRRAEYVYAAAKFYRNLLNGEKADISPLKRAFNRGNYTSGLAFGQDENFLSTKTQSHIGEKVAVVKKIVGQKICVNLKEKISQGSAMKILRNGEEVGNAVFKGGEQGVFDYKGEPRVGDDVCITTDTSLVLPEIKLLPISVDVKIVAEKQIFAKATIKGETVEILGEITQTSKTKPLTIDMIKNCFAKVDKYPFAPNIDVETKDAFVAISTLNQFRRDFYAKIYEKLTELPKRTQGELELPNYLAKHPKKEKVAVIDSEFDFDLSKIDIAVFAPNNYKDEKLFNTFFVKTNAVKEKYLFIPAFLTEKDVEILDNRVDKFDGIYCENLAAKNLANKWGKKIFYGTGMNIFNAIDIDDKNGYICSSNELTVRESEVMDCENIFVQVFGGIAVMNFAYCPFGKKCSNCNAKEWSKLTDESGREFSLRKYILGECRFQLFNCLPLVGSWNGNILINLLSLNQKQKSTVMENFEDEKRLKDLLRKYTTGHSVKPVN
ncbi:MAG TPA: DUF3656 domain-containing protein [Clostridia bacterium]|nr:DUF3656 domain-containing protein [Clostridia bacterium]